MSTLRIRARTDSNRITLPSIDNVPKEGWEKLAGKKIFFGHHSVGYNIIDGIMDVMDDHNDVRLDVVETCEPAAFERPTFAHGRVGRNMDPGSKIESFANVMDAGVGEKADIAFFKFCYVDVMADSDPQKIFDLYSAALEQLRERYAETTFIHVTVPLHSTPKGIERTLKQSIKRLIGRPSVLEDNIRRERYNELLRNAYSKTEPVFDLALIETINPEGFRCYVPRGTEQVFVMVPEYTDDGGHLNAAGRKRVAEQLLIMLAEEANKLP